MAHLSTCLDTPTVMSVDKLQLDACSDALTVVSMSRRLPKPYSQGPTGRLSSYCRRPNPGMGTVRKNFAVQITFSPLTCLEITVGRCPSAKFWYGYFTQLTKQQQFVSDSSFSSNSANVWQCLDRTSTQETTEFVSQRQLVCTTCPSKGKIRNYIICPFNTFFLTALCSPFEFVSLRRSEIS